MKTENGNKKSKSDYKKEKEQPETVREMNEKFSIGSLTKQEKKALRESVKGISFLEKVY